MADPRCCGTQPYMTGSLWSWNQSTNGYPHDLRVSSDPSDSSHSLPPGPHPKLSVILSQVTLGSEVLVNETWKGEKGGDSSEEALRFVTHAGVGFARCRCLLGNPNDSLAQQVGPEWNHFFGLVHALSNWGECKQDFSGKVIHHLARASFKGLVSRMLLCHSVKKEGQLPLPHRWPGTRGPALACTLGHTS